MEILERRGLIRRDAKIGDEVLPGFISQPAPLAFGPNDNPLISDFIVIGRP